MNNKTKENTTPKLTTLQMSREEVLELENVSLKMEMLKASQQATISKICKRLGQKQEDLYALNPQTSVIEFLEKTKKENN